MLHFVIMARRESKNQLSDIKNPLPTRGCRYRHHLMSRVSTLIYFVPGGFLDFRLIKRKTTPLTEHCSVSVKYALVSRKHIRPLYGRESVLIRLQLWEIASGV